MPRQFYQFLYQVTNHVQVARIMKQKHCSDIIFALNTTSRGLCLIIHIKIYAQPQSLRKYQLFNCFFAKSLLKHKQPISKLEEVDKWSWNHKVVFVFIFCLWGMIMRRDFGYLREEEVIGIVCPVLLRRQ